VQDAIFRSAMESLENNGYQILSLGAWWTRNSDRAFKPNHLL